MKCPACRTDNPSDSKFCKECSAALPAPKVISAPQAETLLQPIKELAAGTNFSGRYQVIEGLGEGGMGKVYKVFDNKIKEKIALKLIRPELALDAEVLERFSREMTLARKIGHRNVCRMFDLGEADGAHFLTMEYVSGVDLKTMIRMSGSLGVGTVLSIGKQVADGLAEAHNLGIVHRDLKPQNIMIDKSGGAKIMDFGIARSIQEKGMTGAKVMIGTPGYMSPEQAEALDVDHRSDIYSLGIILYEMATGLVPFEGETAVAIAMKQKGETPKNPKGLNPHISDDLAGVILKCLEKDRSQRYQTAADVRAELERIEKGLPTTERAAPKPRPSTSKEITVKFQPRKFAIPALAVIVVIAAAYFVLRSRPAKLPALSTTGKPSLAVMYFENRTGEPSLEKILVEMLTTNLSRYEQIEVVSSQRLFDILKLMGKQDLPAIDKTVATEIAARAGVKTMLMGSISKLGEKILVSSQLTDVQTGNVITSEQSEGRNFDDIQKMVDDLTAKIGSRMAGPSAGQMPAFKIVDVSTASRQAYRHYLEGLESCWRWELAKAEKSFQEAVEVDPTFGPAYLWLALMKARFGMALNNPATDFASIENAYDMARKYSEKATEKDRLLIAALTAEDLNSRKMYLRKLIEKYPKDKLAHFFISISDVWLAGDFIKGKAAIEKALELDPADGMFYNQLAYTNMFLGDKAGATSAIRKYISLQPDLINPYDSGWETHMNLGMPDEAERFLHEAMRVNPQWHLFRRFRGWTALFRREPDKAREEFRDYASKYPTSVMANLYPSYADLFENKFAAAITQCKKAVQTARNSNNDAVEMNVHLALGKILTAVQRQEEAIAEFVAAEKISRKRFKPDYDIFSAQARYLVGVSEVRKGDLGAAEASAGSLPSTGKFVISPSPIGDYRILLTAEINLAKKAFPAAHEALSRISVGMSLSSPRYHKISADVAVLEGDYKKAIEEYEYFCSTASAILPIYFLADQVFYIEVASRLDYYLAQVYEKMGDLAKAAEHYRKFLDLMKNADPGITEIADAQKRLAGLSFTPSSTNMISISPTSAARSASRSSWSG